MPHPSLIQPLHPFLSPVLLSLHIHCQSHHREVIYQDNGRSEPGEAMRPTPRTRTTWMEMRRQPATIDEDKRSSMSGPGSFDFAKYRNAARVLQFSSPVTNGSYNSFLLCTCSSVDFLPSVVSFLCFGVFRTYGIKRGLLSREIGSRLHI